MIVVLVRFESARFGDLIGVEIDSDHGRRFDERHDLADFFEIHAAAAAKAVDDLLHPRRARFDRRGDDYVSRTGFEGVERRCASFRAQVRLQASQGELNCLR